MCHVSVGHVAREFERAGLVTVCVFIEAFAHYAEAMHLPRTLVVRHPMGRPIGPPGDVGRHDEVVATALRLVDEVTGPGTLVGLGGDYRPGS